MKSEMTSYERLDAAWNLEEPDRVPVAPVNCYILPYLAGISIKEMFTEPNKLIEATVEAREMVGGGDNVDPNITTLEHLGLLPKSGWDRTTLDWTLTDNFPPEGSLPGLREKEIIEDYDDLMERGYSTLLFNQKINDQVFERDVEDFLYYEYEYPDEYAEAWRGFVEDQNIPLLMGGRACHPLDLLQYSRGISQLASDMYERPEKVKEVSEWLLDYEIMRAMEQAETMGAGEVPGAEIIFFVNGGPPGMPPKIFDELFWPFAKKAVDTWVKRGYRVHCHWDNDLTPHLDTIKGLTDGLPEGRVRLDLEKTDMKKAKEVLGDKMCIHGNVNSRLLTEGTPEEVDQQCKQLIEDCAEGGGYILSTECETPWDAKPENVKAIVDAAKKYGQY